MKLFRRRAKPTKQSEETSVPAPVSVISLSEEQERLLETPLDPQEADKLLQKIYSSKAAAERALEAQRIIDFPHNGLGQRHIIQDERGFWRVVSGPSPEKTSPLLGGL